MNPKFQDALRKGMHVFGRVVEAVIGQAKKAKVSVVPAHGIEPILAIEGQLPMAKIRELILVSIDRLVKPVIPNLVDKSSLEMTQGQMIFSNLMKEKGAAVSIHVDIGDSAGSYPKDVKSGNFHSIRASARSIPFEDGFFDFVVANLATSQQGDIVRVVKEIGRAVTLGGTAVIVDFHPFGRFAKKGSVRLKSIESIVRGVEDYYKICKNSGFSVDYVREAFIDETVRKLFVSPEEKSSFRSIKDTPFLIFLMVSKKGR